VKSLEVLHQLRHGYRRPVQYRLSFRDDDVCVEVARIDTSGPNGVNCNLKCVGRQRARAFARQAPSVNVELVFEFEEPAREVAHVGSEGVGGAVEQAPIL
jgi:hypothetical protein